MEMVSLNLHIIDDINFQKIAWIPMKNHEKPEKSHENPNLFWPRDRCVRAKEALEKVDRDEDTDASQMSELSKVMGVPQ